MRGFGKQKSAPLLNIQNNLRDRLVQICSHRIFSDKLPDKSDLKNIALEIENVVRRDLMDNKPHYRQNFQIDRSETFDTIVAEFTEWLNAHPLVFPPPVFHNLPDSKKIVATTATGSVLGALLGAVLLNLGLRMPQIGLLLGAPAGAGGFLSLIFASFRVKKLGFISRLFMSDTKSFNRQEYLNLLESVTGLWLNNVFLYFRLLLERNSGNRGSTDTRSLARLYTDYVHKLYSASTENLPDIVAEMMTRAHNLGIEGLEGEPAFLSGHPDTTRDLVWAKDMEKLYRTFGVIEVNDRVFVEEKPVVQDGVVLKKGVVRKKRH